MSYSLVCPFLTDDPNYAYGVELGMLFEQMKIETKIKNYFTMANQEQITLLCNRTGWTIKDMIPWGKDWVFIDMAKA